MMNQKGQGQAAPPAKPEHRTVRLADLRLDPDVQPRVGIDEAAVSDYRDAIRAGESLGPIIAFDDGRVLWVADGFHRAKAYSAAGLEEIPAVVHKGSRRDAILWAVGSNAAHGLRRTNADKRRAVGMLLSDPEWAGKSDREIGRQCRVDHKTVASVRAELIPPTGEIPRQPGPVSPAERMTPEEARDALDRVIAEFRGMGEAAAAIRDEELYRESHATFEEWLAEADPGGSTVRNAIASWDARETDPEKEFAHFSTAVEAIIGP